MFLSIGGGIGGLLTLLLFELTTWISIGSVGLSNTDVQDLALDREFKIPATVSLLNLGPIEVWEFMLYTSHGRGPTVIVPVEQAGDKVHRLSVFRHRVVFPVGGLGDLLPQQFYLGISVGYRQGVICSLLVCGLQVRLSLSQVRLGLGQLRLTGGQVRLLIGLLVGGELMGLQLRMISPLEVT